ncbi:P-loop containing nucleoside triphosphate hydrolase protein [Xylaria acuta]|nr:P-loop containing nucleoside triphosphate hydrolase protein [Xylaria acuta]
MVIDSKALDLVVSLVLPSIQAHRKQIHAKSDERKPFVLGLSGLQGSGKSTWATSLAKALSDRHHFKTVVLSLDDLYLPHVELVRLREANPNNSLYRNRGQPGTHDEVLARQFFGDLYDGKDVALPSFDKSRFNGEGDRVPESEWQKVPRDPPLDVVIFEGWCVGYLSLSNADLEAKWSAARNLMLDNATDSDEESLKFPVTVLGTHPFEHIRLLNDNLKRYNETFLGPCHFDYLIHLDTDRLANVYRWRIQQEEALRAAKGTGQTDDQVVAFVQVYMPAYESYIERLQKEAFVRSKDMDGLWTQARILLDDDRKVISVTEL